MVYQIHVLIIFLSPQSISCSVPTQASVYNLPNYFTVHARLTRDRLNWSNLYKDVELVCMHIFMPEGLSRMAVLLAFLRLNVIYIKIGLLFPAEKCHSIFLKMSWDLLLHDVITTSVKTFFF